MALQRSADGEILDDVAILRHKVFNSFIEQVPLNLTQGMDVLSTVMCCRLLDVVIVP